MILFDTETTGLVGPEIMPIAKQPFIIEFCAVKLDNKTLKETACINFLVNSAGRPAISEEITKITGITEAMLVGQPTFEQHLPAITELFLGETILVAHNCKFDVDMLRLDLTRCGRLTRFPWPPRHVCTVEASTHIMRRRMRLNELYEHATGGGQIQDAHRAINDVRALAECVRWLSKEGKVKFS